MPGDITAVDPAGARACLEFVDFTNYRSAINADTTLNDTQRMQASFDALVAFQDDMLAMRDSVLTQDIRAAITENTFNPGQGQVDLNALTRACNAGGISIPAG